eukprot:8700202-Pyramimonas_sp.AAC.1
MEPSARPARRPEAVRRPEVWKLCTANITSWGIECGDKGKVTRRPLLELCDSVDADIYVFQEHHQTSIRLVDIQQALVKAGMVSLLAPAAPS